MRTCNSLFWLALACVIAGVLFVTDLIPAGRAPVAYLLLRVGAVLMGVDLVWRALERRTRDNTTPSQPTASELPVSDRGCGCGDCGCGASDQP